jgi:hypothetical protein
LLRVCGDTNTEGRRVDLPCCLLKALSAPQTASYLATFIAQLNA